MVAGPQQQQPAFDPAAAGAMLRRERVATIRQRQSVEGRYKTTTPTETTVRVTREQNPSPAMSAPASPSRGAAPSRGPAPRAGAPNTQRQIPSPTPIPQSRGTGANRFPAPLGTPYGEMRANNGRLINNRPPSAPEQDRRQIPPARRQTPSNAQAREDYKKSYQPQPPLRTPPPAPNPEADAAEQESAAADRQLDAANGTNDFAAQARARGNAARTAAKAKKAQAENEESSLTDDGIGFVYSLIFQGGGAADELCEDGGVGATIAQSGNLYMSIMTMFPDFNDKLRQSELGKFLPDAFDLGNRRGRDGLLHFFEWMKGIAAGSEMLLYILIILLVPVLIGVCFAFVTNPLLGIQAFLSTF